MYYKLVEKTPVVIGFQEFIQTTTAIGGKLLKINKIRDVIVLTRFVAKNESGSCPPLLFETIVCSSIVKEYKTKHPENEMIQEVMLKNIKQDVLKINKYPSYSDAEKGHHEICSKIVDEIPL